MLPAGCAPRDINVLIDHRDGVRVDKRGGVRVDIIGGVRGLPAGCAPRHINVLINHRDGCLKRGIQKQLLVLAVHLH